MTSEETPDPLDDYYEYQDIIVDPGQEPLRLDKFLHNRLGKVSRSRIQNAIRFGGVKVNQKEVKPNFKIKPGHKIELLMPKPPEEGGRAIPEDIPLNIVYEDDDLLVVNKSAGMVVHPGIGNRNGTLINALAYHYKDLPVMPGNDSDRIGLVHRIDKDTSGLLVVAKSDQALQHLARQFFDHTVVRRYHALVWGEPEELEGTIRGYIGRDTRDRRRFVNYAEEDQGKWAVTHYKVIDPMYYVSLVECQLETGRTHQIRVHMKYLGHPLFSDERYGGDRIMKGTVYSKYKQFVDNCFKLLPRQGLHARTLGFVHPRTGEELFFESELPEDMAACLEKWRKYVDAKRQHPDNTIE